jgi:putative DNA primase/helicase
MSAETIAKALGGRRAGSCWMARCPVHEDREPSLSIRDRDGTVLLHCHAGCDQRRLIGALRACGLWDNAPRGATPTARNAGSPRDRGDRHGKRRRDWALAIWEGSKPADGTLVEVYLASRGLTLAPPARLRFHPGLKHPLGGIWPAMVALVTDGVDDVPIGIHRTFLASNGSGKAPVEPQKMMLGPCRGGAVCLGAVEDVLLVGEGIETCLSAMQATGRPAWAALSTSGLKNLHLPDTIIDVIIAADGDETGERAAQECVRRWRRPGRRVRIARPPTGADFNDVMRRPLVEGGA